MSASNIIDAEMPSVEVTIDESSKTSSSRNRHYVLLATTLSLVLLVLGFSNSTHMKTAASSSLRSLLELTNAGDVMPVPFWIIRQDVPEAMKVQNAFYNFYTLRDKSVKKTDGDSTYTVKFFEDVTVEKDGKTTHLGYFNPLSPQGLSSLTFMFNYGDKCAATNDYTEGQVDLVCGNSLEIVDVSMIAACRYKLTVSSPELCSAADKYSFLKATTVEAADNGWWQYRVNFFKHGAKSASPVLQFHTGKAHAERFHLGNIHHTLNADNSMQFSKGDLCEPTGKHREGKISVECGCDYEITKFDEVSMCVYEMVVAHPQACASGKPASCKSSSLRSKLAAKEELAEISKPDWNEIYSTRMDESAFPRSLLKAKYTK